MTCSCTGKCKVPPYTCSGQVSSITLIGGSTTHGFTPYPDNLSLKCDIDNCFEKIKVLEETIKLHATAIAYKSKKPHICPVCDARSKDCRGCEGTGIVWG